MKNVCDEQQEEKLQPHKIKSSKMEAAVEKGWSLF